MQLLAQCNNASSVQKAVSGHPTTLLCCLVEWATAWTQILIHSSKCLPAQSHTLRPWQEAPPFVSMPWLNCPLDTATVDINFDSKKCCTGQNKVVSLFWIHSLLIVFHGSRVEKHRLRHSGNMFSFLACVIIFTRVELEPCIFFLHIF